RLMREDAQLQQRSRGRRSVAAALLAAAMAGAAIGYVTMPGSSLEQPAVTAVERRASPLAQIYYAKVNPSEAAWLAVEEYFPNLDPFERDLAREGLARYYLMLSQEFGKARTFLLLLKDSPASEGAQSRLHDFVYAGLVVAYQRLEDYAAAAEAASHLTPAMRDRLRRTDAPMYQLLQSALRSLGT
ncbi:MAG TPA: hypothetical protein PKC18_08020, partial [Lacipirellulaceae bacterium]|nr:hypothetical protein [Lacipirellulaceae bacterium]